MIRTGGEESPDTVIASTGSSTARKPRRPPMDQQRAEFLRSCRARIKPSDLGLPMPQRKRTSGLRREDVAALSGVSVSWYTWLEQGRDMRVSDEVLERICHTFRLTEDERVYLFSLVQHRPPRIDRASRFEAPAELMRMINSVSAPAVVMNLRWDVLAWNALNSALHPRLFAVPGWRAQPGGDPVLASTGLPGSAGLREHGAPRAREAARGLQQVRQRSEVRSAHSSPRQSLSGVPAHLAHAGNQREVLRHSPLQARAVRRSDLRAHVVCARWTSDRARGDLHA